MSVERSNKRYRNVNGILLVDKPEGQTSNDTLQKCKRIYVAAKAGHTGSLDPLASGMLPICFGEATKFSQFLLDADKQYEVVGKLGVTTTTDDAEGDIISTQLPDIKISQVEQALTKFRGEIKQIPSMYSALKHQGTPLYKLARQGLSVAREARTVKIYSLQLLDFQQDLLKLYIKCSKGTYIRTIIADIGCELGCGAHVIKLRRTSVGGYSEQQMVKFAHLVELAEQNDLPGLDKLLLPIEDVLLDYPTILLTDAMQYYILQGQAVMVPNAPTSGWVKLKNKLSGTFLGVGEVTEDGKIAPRRLVSTQK
jgi:tRNA pseudouridine55 synthase